MIEKIRNWYKGLPGILRNKYFVVGMLFLIWMLFVDDYNMFFQWRQSRTISDLQRKCDFYRDEIVSVKKEKDELFSSQEKLEKYAREKYLMKKDNEDLFVIERK